MLASDPVNHLPTAVEFSTQEEKSKGKIFLSQLMMYAFCGQALAVQVMLSICVTEVPCAHSPDQG